MKKLFLLLIVVLLCIGLLAACGGSEQTNGTDVPTDSTVDPTGDITDPTETPDEPTSSPEPTESPDEPTEGPHTCEFGDWTVVTEATCTEDGLKERVCECGEKESETIPATGHVEGEWIVDSEPTCTADGSKHQVCATCGAKINTAGISATGHTEGEWIVDAEATGSTDGSMHQVCATCGATINTAVIPATGNANDGMSLKIHYLRDQNDYDEWCFWIWVVGSDGGKIYELNDFDSFGGVASYTFEELGADVFASGIGFIPRRLDGWTKDCDVDRMIDFADYEPDENNCYHFYIRQGDPNIYSAKELFFTLDDAGRGYVVTGIGTCTDSSIVIPSTYNNLPVIGIAAGAFVDCSQITSITIPDSVLAIGEYAFGDCSGLTKVSLGDGLIYIGEGAFEECGKLTAINIPNSVTYIGDYAFAICSGLINVTIPDSVLYIGDYAFGYCSNLTSITIPDSVTSFGTGVLYGCDSLPEIMPFVQDLTLSAGETKTIRIYCRFDSTNYMIGDGDVISCQWLSFENDLATLQVTAIGSGASNVYIYYSDSGMLTSDCICSTIVVSVPGTTNETWAAIGTIEGTNWDVDFNMTKQADGSYLSEVLYLKAGDEFKVRKDGSWYVNFGADGIPYGSNISVSATGYYRIKLTLGRTVTIELIPVQ